MTEYNENKKSVSEQIVETIRSGGVKMRPKWHFALKTILALTGGIILFLTLIYIASFAIFMLRQTGVLFAPTFGFRGGYVFLRSLPWLLISLLVVFIVVLEILVRHYSFAYRRPLLYSVAGIAFLVIAGGYAVAITSFHGRMFRSAERGELPLAGGFYREYGHQRFRNIHKGSVEEVFENKLTIKNRRDETLSVVMTPETYFPSGSDFSPGDLVVVFGDRDDHAVRASGIRKIDFDYDSDVRPTPRRR